MRISFHGAARTVTGSKHLLQLDSGKNVLLDCGMFQGRGYKTDEMNRHFGFNPTKVDCLILSHAHIDHSGLIPKLVKEGFKGPIYCTPPTVELCRIMLLDSAHIQEDDAKYLNKKRAARGRSLLTPLYTTADIEKVLELFQEVPYDKPTRIFDDLELTFTEAGHILGSAVVNLKCDRTRITFTGDIGRYSNHLLKAPAKFPQADYLICESTYGDRLHESVEQVDERLLQVVNETCVMKQGKLLIPAFSIGRTQEIVNVLNNLEFQGRLPRIPVYVDSPLSYNATEVIKKFTYCFNDAVQEQMKKDPTPFDFNRLHYIRDVMESKALNESKEPCIIISASGMAEAGRIKHHIKNNVENPNTTILLAGWATPSSLGGRLKAGEKKVSIFGKEYAVNADVVVMDPFSAHGDYAEMLRFLECQNPAKVRCTFLVHGDDEIMPIWKNRLHNVGFENIEMPTRGQAFDL